MLAGAGACVLQAAPALLTHTSFGAPLATPTTSSAINTTGATLLIVTINQYNVDPTTATVTDSKSNTWVAGTPALLPGGESNVAIWYSWQSLSAGSGHTVTVTGSFAGVVFAAFSGTQTSSNPIDQQNGSTTVQPNPGPPQSFGSITPSTTGTLVISVLGIGTGATLPFTATGTTAVDSIAQTGGVNEGNGTSYVVQTSAVAVNPAWAWSGATTAVDIGGVNASFKAAAGGGGSTRASQGFTF